MVLNDIRFQLDGPTATLAFNRPAVRNALSPALLAEAVSAVESLPGSECRVLVVTGVGGAFSAGADLKVLADPAFTREQAREFQSSAERLTYLLETIPQVTIARVEGLCLTGALEIALACDLIVAAEDAQFADTHAKIGFRPMWGLTQRLPRRVGLQRAREMSFTARRVDGREAAAIGLALEAVPAERLDARIAELAQSISANHRDSIAAYRTLYRESQNRHLDAGLRYEADVRLRIRR